jgi:hypothetical protein
MSNSFRLRFVIEAGARICRDRGALMVAQAVCGLNFLHAWLLPGRIFARETSNHFSFVQAFVATLIHRLHEPAWNSCL